MSKQILKVAFAGGALVIAASAVGYTQITSFKTPAAQTVASVAQDVATPQSTATQVAAFVTETRQMGKPAVATLADMQDARTFVFAQGLDNLGDGPSTGDIMDDIDISDLLDGLNSDGNIPGATPAPRPAGPRVATNTPKFEAVVAPKPTASKSKSKERRVKRRIWSTGQYR